MAVLISIQQLLTLRPLSKRKLTFTRFALVLKTNILGKNIMIMACGIAIGNTAPQSVNFYAAVLQVVPSMLLMPTTDLS